MKVTTIKELQKELEAGSTPSDLVNEAIIKLQNSEQYNAIVFEMFDQARMRAVELEKEFAKTGIKGKLYGIPFVVKDNLLVKGSNTTAASNILKNFTAPYSATAVKKLEDEGAILIAKANLDAFGHGSSTENSDFATTLNPHDKTKVPGGSSGGSAAVVALGAVPFALGTDTGGSIRLPASFCGVMGLKPSYGSVSRSGVVSMASSTDCVGPIASSAEDLGMVLDIIAGKDGKDSTTIARPVGIDASPSAKAAQGYKVGLIKELAGEGLDSEVADRLNATVASLKNSGIVVEEISIPEIKYALAAYYIIVPAEISSNLARYDGIRYGMKSEGANGLSATYTKSRQKGLNAENKRRILIGTYVLSSGYYDAYYKKAQQVRTLLKQAYDEALDKYDVLISPVAPTTAFKIGENSENPLQMYLADIMTVGPSLIGSPALSIPVGRGVSTNMPVGLQIVSGHRNDNKVLNFAALIEDLRRKEN